MSVRRRAAGSRTGGRFASAVVSCALLLAACGGSAALPSGLSDEEARYVEDVLAAHALFEERNAELGAALQQAYRTNEALFAALESAGAGSAFEPGLEALEALAPPPRFTDDHELLLEQQRSRVLIDREIGTAVAERDLARFVILNMRLGLVGTSTPRLAEPLCVAVMAQDLAGHPVDPAYLAESLCDREPLPGDGYGDAVREALREPTIALEARSAALGFFDLVPQVDAATEREVAGEAFTEVIQVIGSMHDELRALEVPDRMATDHERLLTYLEELEAHVRDLTDAALAGDREAFTGSDFPELYCGAREAVGFAYRPIVRVHFADLFAACPDSPPF